MFKWLSVFSKAPEETKWNPETLNVEVQQPTSPEAPSTKLSDIERSVCLQVVRMESFLFMVKAHPITQNNDQSIDMKLRGGGGGGACCGV